MISLANIPVHVSTGRLSIGPYLKSDFAGILMRESEHRKIPDYLLTDGRVPGIYHTSSRFNYGMNLWSLQLIITDNRDIYDDFELPAETMLPSKPGLLTLQFASKGERTATLFCSIDSIPKLKKSSFLWIFDVRTNGRILMPTVGSLLKYESKFMLFHNSGGVFIYR